MAKHRRHDRRGVALAAVLGGVAAITVVVLQVAGDDAGGPSAADGRATVGAADSPGASCTELAVVSSATFVPVLDALADDLGSGEDCVRLAVSPADGRAAVAGLAASDPHVWVPDDASWVSGADPAVVGPPPQAPTVVATSPIHVVAGAEAADRLGADGVSWAELAALAADPAPPTFVSRQPADSGEGLVAAGGVGEVVWAATGMDDASGALRSASSRTRPVDGAVATDVGPGEIGLVAEQSLLAAGPPSQGRVAMAATDLTAVLRYTWVPTVRDAGNPVIEAARARLLATLTGEGGVAALAEAGLRPPDMAQPDVDWLPATTAPAMDPLGSHHVEHVFAAWYEEDRMADHLVVVDVSGSMWAVPPGGDRTLLEEVKDGVIGVADQLPDSARYGVWQFGSSLDPPRDHLVVSEPTELTAAHRDALAASVGQLRPRETGTGLHDTIVAAYLAAQSSQRPGVRSHVLVFTDGTNEADPGSLTLPELGARLAAVADPQRPVSLAVVVYGPDAAAVQPPLAEQLEPVQGYVSSARTVTDVVDVFAHVAAGGLHG